MERRPDPDYAGRQVYELTAAGRELWPVVYALLVWGRRHGRPNSRVFVHASCQTELDEAARCPRCNLTPDLADIVTRPRPGRKHRREDPVAVALRRPHRMLEPIVTT